MARMLLSLFNLQQHTILLLSHVHANFFHHHSN